MFGEGETLGDEMIVDDCKGTGGKEVGRDVEVSSISCALSESSCGEAMGWDMSEGGGEDGVFGLVEGRRSFVLVRMIGAGTMPNESRSKMYRVPQDYVQWPYDNHASTNLCQTPAPSINTRAIQK